MNSIKTSFLITLGILFSSPFFSQTRNPKRTVLYTLADNEIISYNEYYASLEWQKNNFFCLVEDTVLKKKHLIFNGQKKLTADWMTFKITSLDETNGYIAEYSLDKKLYVDYKGLKLGPYRDTHIDHYEGTNENNFTFQNEGDNNWYAYEDGEITLVKEYVENKDRKSIIKTANWPGMEKDKWYLKSDGEILNEEGYDAIGYYGYNKGMLTYFYMEDSKLYYHIDGTDYGPYDGDLSSKWDGSDKLIFSESGEFAFAYELDGKYYLNISGESKGPFSNNFEFGWTRKNFVFDFFYEDLYHFNYTKKGKNYLCINGSILKTHDTPVKNLKSLESGIFAFVFSKKGKSYLNINNSKTVQIESDVPIYTIELNDNGQYAYSFEKEGQTYIDFNGEIINVAGDYKDGLELSDGGEYSFYFRKNDNLDYINENGTIRKLEDPNSFFRIESHEWKDINMKSKDENHVFFSSFDNEYVLIDGNRFGKSAASDAWYDQSNNVFVWSAIENKELVVYEFSLD